jgi:LEA14-like dessication related protein
MNNRFPKYPVVIAVLLALIFSCAFLRESIGLGPVPPKVRLVSIRIKNLSMQTIDIVGTFQVDNPNIFAIELSFLKYQLQVLDRTLASGSYEEHFKVGAKDTATVDLPFLVSMQEVVFIVKSVFAQGDKLVAVMTATARFNTPIGNIDVDFQDQKPLK